MNLAQLSKKKWVRITQHRKVRINVPGEQPPDAREKYVYVGPGLKASEW